MNIYTGVIENKRLDQENILPAVLWSGLKQSTRTSAQCALHDNGDNSETVILDYSVIPFFPGGF